MRASLCRHIYTHTCVRIHACICTRVAVPSPCGKARRRTRRLKKGAICRAMVGTLCAWECRWGYIYNATLPFRYIFCPASDFLAWRLPAYARMTQHPPPRSMHPLPFSLACPSASVIQRGAQRFLFQIFSISIKRERDRERN